MAVSKNRKVAKLASSISVDGTLSSDGLAAGAGGGLDSANVIALIDSDYVTARETNASGGLDSAAVLSLTTGSIIAYNTILSGDD